MKKGILITIGVVALLAIMVWADHKFPANEKIAGGAGVANAPTGAPTISLKDDNNQDVKMAQYKGKVVLVNFWATWCEPCKSEIPSLIEFQQKYGPRGFTILGISMDEDGKKAIDPFLAKERFDVDGQKEAMNYPILLGSDNIADKFGGVIGLPTSMLYGRDGKKIRTIVGPVNPEEISKYIESLL